jgi:hypothetical protein
MQHSLFDLIEYCRNMLEDDAYANYAAYSDPDLQELKRVVDEIEDTLEYEGGLMDLIDDIYRIMYEQFESDFFDETEEELEWYLENFITLLNRVTIFIRLLYSHNFPCPDIPEEGQIILGDWKNYINSLINQLEIDRNILCINSETARVLFLFLSQRIKDFPYLTLPELKLLERYNAAFHNSFLPYAHMIPHLISKDEAFEDLMEFFLNSKGHIEEKIENILQKIQHTQELTRDELRFILNHMNTSIFQTLESKLSHNNPLKDLILKRYQYQCKNSFHILL